MGLRRRADHPGVGHGPSGVDCISGGVEIGGVHEDDGRHVVMARVGQDDFKRGAGPVRQRREATVTGGLHRWASFGETTSPAMIAPGDATEKCRMVGKLAPRMPGTIEDGIVRIVERCGGFDRVALRIGRSTSLLRQVSNPSAEKPESAQLCVALDTLWVEETGEPAVLLPIMAEAINVASGTARRHQPAPALTRLGEVAKEAGEAVAALAAAGDSHLGHNATAQTVKEIEEAIDALANAKRDILARSAAPGAVTPLRPAHDAFGLDHTGS